MNHKTKGQKQECAICGQMFLNKDLTPYGLVSHDVSSVIKNVTSGWEEGKYICFKDLNHLRSEYIKESILKNQNEISDIEHAIIQSINEHEAVSENINELYNENISFGDRLADKIATFGGSWIFIILFISIIVIWVSINSAFLINKTFDPYPFILLNLILSSLAAFQAPIIMMSQNRQAKKDRIQAEMDYKVNLKAELEIRQIKTKLDQLSSHQWQRLLEIQELQNELLQKSEAP